MEVTNSVEDTQTKSLYAPNEISFDNGVFRCLVLSPAGREICEFQSIKELLEALRDAIKAQKRTLLFRAKCKMMLNSEAHNERRKATLAVSKENALALYFER